MTRLAQLSLVSKTRGLIVWTFWRDESDVSYVASSIDAYGNTNRREYNTRRELRHAYDQLRKKFGYTPVAA